MTQKSCAVRMGNAILRNYLELLLLQIKLVEKGYCCLRALFFFFLEFSEELSNENKMNLSKELYFNCNLRWQNIVSCVHQIHHLVDENR